MEFDLDRRRARLSVGELADFTLGPRGAKGGPSGIWRAQLGIQWHRRLQAEAPEAESEVGIEGEVAHRGWIFTLSGRIDQVLPGDAGATTLREIKTVTRPSPAAPAALRAEVPVYFAQLAAYAELRRLVGVGERAEIVFVEAGTGLAQIEPLLASDDALFRVRLDRVVEFLERRRQTRDRLRDLRFRPPFAVLRPGQESIQADLAGAWTDPPVPLLLAAPTGFGKTGVLLEFALGQLRAGRYDRAIYLTSKSTGQLQVVRTLGAMAGGEEPEGGGAAAWHVRNKGEHCVNPVFHCIREACPYLDGAEDRWPESGLARFYLEEGHPRDLDSLRTAGRAARICPYEITRAALAFQQVWIGDYNYVFAPAARGLFYDQPGFDPGRSLLLVDEAHNLPSRAADAHSHGFSADDAEAVSAALARLRAPASLVLVWNEWTHLLSRLASASALAEADEADARGLLRQLADLIATESVDQAGLGPRVGELLWQIPAVCQQLEETELARLWWCPRAGRLALTCLDAAPDIGVRLREFGGVVLASATPGPIEDLAAALGLEEREEPDSLSSPPEEAPRTLGALGPRQTRQLYARLASGADLLRAREARVPALVQVEAPAPWRDRAYTMAVDVRVDTTFQHRARHYPATAGAIAQFQAAGPAGSRTPLAVFFSSYAYAEHIVRTLEESGAALRVALQPRQPDLALQAAWVDASLAGSDVLFLILGSSFAESIDLLGGRVGREMVVGPALPEVNAVQQARLAAVSALGREAAFRRIYQIPGMQKVNQALGRLVRAPGQRARILLHCRRFAEPAYARLLAPEYQEARRISSDEDFNAWVEEVG